MGKPVTLGGLDAGQAQNAINAGMSAPPSDLSLAPPENQAQPAPTTVLVAGMEDKRVSGDTTRNPLGQHSRPNNRTR